ncbi:MAG: hypothetical protein KTR31_37270 [Myxococcales bacterium]|nr:hypothetical protein [Myxococcales bacterium]
MRTLPLGMGLLVGLVACDEPPPVPPGHPCDADTTALDAAPPRGEFGDLVDGSALWCAIPPQGGAPYSPFRVRVQGPEALSEGVWLSMTAVDRDDGEELAYTDLNMGVTCANVGDSAGFWVSSEAHMRYSGWALDELDGRRARIELHAESLDGSVVIDHTADVDLVLDLE